MAPRIPISFARPPEALCYSAASVTALAPLYLIMPGAEERLATQTARWAPRWERNISIFSPPFERGIQRVEPPVARAVRRIEHRLPLEKVALGAERRIKNTIDRASKHQRLASQVTPP